ncbi:flagellar hook-basal body complex protein FliE [uncultured Sphingomonas sp.]|uniref:flagellar hook-basal body complex protein FliE n=1 Tax=uncultured Sphingomonas sp. TaxID=158754 RepID=UPI0025D9DE5D|nr:flagellar hook-basal body complex protein FliE [uncultured Sphingomonas sp.]
MSAASISAIAAVGTPPLALPITEVAAPAAASQNQSFGALLMQGLQGVDAKLNAADTLVRRFAIDDDVPVHQVTMALEEARLSVELAMQVRGRLIESYRELMNMQL